MMVYAVDRRGNDAWVEVFPVGALFFTSIDVNPALLLGWGAWSAEINGLLTIGVGTIRVFVWRRTA